ncbi:nitroreductase family protein [Histomonas meleagridis]|uniref:nitroreductase family protein n=1 Tax=Histomonas meleagridis TaxID=135588 RepID=UPI00355A03FB|nr:nitroreductase family protein [Histomonas meleagridis]KAH0798144.1 nitroreductase family protein [Histomonas meleagridis]
MDVLEAIKSRRSYRNFDVNYEIPEEDLQKIIEVVLSSPTACNYQDIDLLVVTNKQKIDEATKIIFDSWDKNMQDSFNKRIQEYGCKNVITGDATCVIFLVENERATDPLFKDIDAGIISMSIMASVRVFGLDTLCLGSLLWGNTKGLEQYLGIGEGKLRMAVAIGKSRDRSKVGQKEQLCKATYIK